MEIGTIQGERRTLAGHQANARMRRSGLLPAVVYGHGQPPEYLSLSLHDLQLALHHMQHVIKVLVDAKEEQYLIKEVQYDHLQQTPIHIDLMRVDVTERVKVKVALELRGVPAGAAAGGVLVQMLTDLDVECQLLHIPRGIRVRVDHLELSQVLHVRDIAVPEDVRCLNTPGEIVAIVQPPRAAETPTPAEAVAGAQTTEPEVIGRGPKDAQEGEGGE